MELYSKEWDLLKTQCNDISLGLKLQRKIIIQPEFILSLVKTGLEVDGYTAGIIMDGGKYKGVMLVMPDKSSCMVLNNNSQTNR